MMFNPADFGNLFLSKGLEGRFVGESSAVVRSLRWNG